MSLFQALERKKYPNESVDPKTKQFGETQPAFSLIYQVAQLVVLNECHSMNVD
jgi:hypothetical protein